jgi:alpha-beta hydrolase superfamily lysophospholipase
MGVLGTALRYFAIAALLLLAAVFLVRAWQSMQGPPLNPWHNFVPDEPTPAEIDGMGWPQWLAREDRLFASVKSEVTDKLPESARIPQNRYWAEAPMHPANLRRDWNRSYTLAPDGAPLGVAVMLHGLTDAPYSLRHVALFYQARGWAVVGVRLPGHGTVPGGLTRASVEQWQAITRLGVREAMRLAPGRPVHLVGYSNGAALAVAHAADATADAKLGTPQQIILFSPMVGLTPFARFTGLAAIPAVFPAFVKASWLDVIPEYNPFKYNSFPVRAGAEAHRLTVVLADKLAAARADGRIARMPPVLAFQSVVDSTVSAPAVISGLFDLLPANGSELVLVDVNRAAYVGPLVRPSALAALDGLLRPGQQGEPARRYTVSVIANAAAGDPETVVRRLAPGATTATDEPLGIPYRRDFFSLGHVALPFPLSDGLYGANPDPVDDQGVALGALATRGENGVLGISPAALSRVSSNPFLPWMLGRIDATLKPAAAPGDP